MSEILLIFASRYGSTKKVSEMIAEKLCADRINVTVKNVNENPDTYGFEMVLLGSGIYAHKMLPEMEYFIDNRKAELAACKLGMFGVAMRTEIIRKGGRSFGGELILDRYGFEPVLKGMLHGRMDFSQLTEKDREGLERFYNSIGLTEEQKSERRKLRDEISEDECTAFAEKVKLCLKS